MHKFRVGNNKGFSKTEGLLLGSFVGLIIMCMIVFLGISGFMETKSTEAINEIGVIYMSEMSRQLKQKFGAFIDLRLSQAQGIVKRTPEESAEYGPKMLEELALGASVREFSYLALCAEDGECETVYGVPVHAYKQKEFLEVLDVAEKKITSGLNEDGERQLIMVVPAVYPMKDGKTSVALVAGFPMEQLNKALVLEEENALVYSHIIQKDGSFVVRNGEAYQNSYFDRIRESFSEFNGKNSEDYVQEIEAAMSSDEDYSSMIQVNGVHSHVYCSRLPETDWYLVSIMPYGTLDDAVRRLGGRRQYVMLLSCCAMIVGILIIFVLYYRMTRQQMKQLREAREEAVHANKAKSEFLSNMSHDIRTPMNGIVGMTAIAITNIDDQARVRDCLRKISLSSKHLLGLINDVLDMSKIENGKLTLNYEQISLKDTMENIVSIVQPQIKAKNQHFDIFIRNCRVEEVHCDSVRLNQVLLNLLSNALKFTPEGGTINTYLDQEESPKGPEYVRCRFRVKDTGIGMSKEYQEKIFDTFSREDTSMVHKIEGTGLGMAITKYIVDVMGGTISVKSRQGEGSEFCVILDLESADVLEKDMILPSWHVLVVDNNEDLCRSATESLKEIGAQGEWTLEGRTAVEMVEKRHRMGDDYQAVLLDWKMPDMDGLEVAKKIRSCAGGDIPILIVSAYDWSDIEEEAVAAGVNGFISKPLFKSNLYLGLSRYMEGTSEQTEQKEKESVDFTGKRILLSEDNDLNWEIAEEILSEEGFELERAENGKICVEKFEQSEEGFYDVILMDIRMPVMNGYDACVAIRKLDRSDANLPIIAMTADAFSDDVQRCRECGMNEHVSKPIDTGRLTRILKDYLK